MKRAVFILALCSTSAFADAAAGVSKDEIELTVRQHQGAVRACYDKVLQHDPNAKGQLVVDWKIETDGRVTGAKVSKSTIRDLDLGDCVIKQVSGWKFKASTQATDVNYPFNFNAS